MLDVIGWAVSASRFNYDGRIVVGKRPLLDEWAVRVSLEVFDGSVDETNSQGVVHRFLVVVARGVTCPSDQTVRGDVGIHARAERRPYLGMAVGKTDFDVADVGSVVAPLARNIDNGYALWLCGGRTCKG